MSPWKICCGVGRWAAAAGGLAARAMAAAPAMQAAVKPAVALAVSLASWALPLAAPAVRAATLPPDLGERLLQAYIQPAMREFHDSTRALQEALDAHCARPAATTGQAVGREFAAVVRAWSYIEFLRFGPLMEQNRYERVHFWPDPRGVVLRQVRQLVDGTGEMPDVAALATQSVALQGLPALEYLLYREHGLLSQPAAAPRRSCGHAQAVAGNLAAIGAELAAEWRADSEFGRQFVQPAPGRALYRDQREVASEAFKALSTGLQFARTVKLQPVLGASAQDARPRRAPFWRSGLAARSQQWGIDGLYRFYVAGAYAYRRDEQWMDEGVRGELLRAAQGFEAFPAWEEGLHSAEGHRRLQLASLVLKNAKDIIDEHVAPAFGVRIGFNALDGD